MSHFLHIHGATPAGAALVAAVETALRINGDDALAVLHVPIALPGADPLPVEQDQRLLLCQFEGARADAVAARIDALARGVSGVHQVTHQATTLETVTPGGPEDPRSPAEAVSWFVQYNGPARDPAAFHAYYRTHHVPIVLRMPGVRSLNCYLPAPWSAPAGTHRVDYLLLVQALFDDLEGLLAMRRSGERREGLRDFGNYPAFEGPVTHQAMRSTRMNLGERNA